jgi:hypothetical protein
VGGKDGTVLLTKLVGHGVSVALDLIGGGVHRALQPRQLTVHGMARDGPARDGESLGIDHQRFANGESWRNGNTL